MQADDGNCLTFGDGVKSQSGAFKSLYQIIATAIVTSYEPAVGVYTAHVGITADSIIAKPAYAI